MSGWTTACTSDMTLESSETLRQTWCCPPGQWSCLKVSAGDTPFRECVSWLSTPTEVWVNNVITSDGTESTLWSSWRKTSLSDFPNSAQIKIKHRVFPLDGRLPTVDNKGTKGGLSTGAISGIVVAIVIVFLSFISSATFVVCLRKRKERRLAQTRMHTEGIDTDQKGTGFDTKPELPGHDSEIRELQTLSRRPAELSAQTTPSEMDATAPPVELPS